MKRTCRICGREFGSESGFSYHIREIHVLRGEIPSVEEYYLKYETNGEKGKCAVCGKETEFRSIARGYKKHCSRNCSMNNKEVAAIRSASRVKSLQEKYGVTNISQIPFSRAKCRETKIKRYGSASYTNIEKMRQTCLERYGSESPQKVPAIRDKRFATNMERYGHRSPFTNEEVKKKIRNKCIEKYGADHPQKVREIKDRGLETCKARYGGVLRGSEKLSKQIDATNQEKYGVSHPMQNLEVREKATSTRIEKYGEANILQGSNFLFKKFGTRDINQIPEIKAKQKEGRKRTLKLRYNIENISQLEDTQNKIKESNKEKYGVEYLFQADKFKEQAKQTCLRKYGVERAMQSEEVFKRQQESIEGAYEIRKRKNMLLECVHCQSNLEEQFVEDCNAAGILVEDGDRVPYEFNDSLHMYFVDFLITHNGEKYLVEIKGSHPWHEKSIESGLLESKNAAATEFGKKRGYKDFLFLLDYKKGDICKVLNLSK